jgi:hypothetical protein
MLTFDEYDATRVLSCQCGQDWSGIEPDLLPSDAAIPKVVLSPEDTPIDVYRLREARIYFFIAFEHLFIGALCECSCAHVCDVK